MSVAYTRLDKIRRAHNKAQNKERAELLEECRFRLNIAILENNSRQVFLLNKIIDNINIMMPPKNIRKVFDTLITQTDEGIA